MPPSTPLPYSSSFSSPDEYIAAVLEFATTSDPFRILCGGVHILDFFTADKSLFQAALPEEWQPFLLATDIMRLLDLLVRDDPAASHFGEDEVQPPDSFLEYVSKVRRLSLNRDFTPQEKLPTLPRSVAVGMKPKKIHEVKNFAGFVEQLTEHIEKEEGGDGESISHYVDFGSGQNYLGRALASEPYNRRIVAVEGRENNVVAAKQYDVYSGLAVKPVVRRNKKLWNKIMEAAGPGGLENQEAMAKAIREVAGDEAFDFRPLGQIESQQQDAAYGKGFVQYVSGRLDSGDLSEIVEKIEDTSNGAGEEEAREKTEKKKKKNLMAISIHSCGNLSHFGIRSLVLNPDIKAVAIVGCCYNLLTERLGPPTYKHPFLRPTLQALNGRVIRESAKYDPQGFPMSDRFSNYGGEGIRLNITARMMACQAPQNWNRAESEGFFQRHFFRAVLQRIFLDRGVVQRIRHQVAEDGGVGVTTEASDSPFNMSTNPVIIGSLRKGCYESLRSYVRGVVEKLTTSSEFKQYGDVMREKMAGITDEEIDEYEATWAPRRGEVAATWTLMAFSAIVVESLIVTDRWLFLKERGDVVKDAWVETVFDFHESPRNLVVVGIKR